MCVCVCVYVCVCVFAYMCIVSVCDHRYTLNEFYKHQVTAYTENLYF